MAIEGGQARITLDAQTGSGDPQPHYFNFMPTTATLVDPHGAALQIALPQIAPGRYEATTPVRYSAEPRRLAASWATEPPPLR